MPGSWPRGVDPHSRPARQKVPGKILGSRVTNLQAARRRRPPMVIAARTPDERLVRAWTARELEAIAQAVAAGRVRYVCRGVSGLPEGRTWRELQREAWRLLHDQAA